MRSTGAVLIAFLASWSDPCHAIEPVLVEAARALGGKVDVVKVTDR